MVFEEYFRILVLSRPKIANLIGTRLRMQLQQDEVLPAVRYVRVDTARRGRSRTSPGLVVPRVQLDIFGNSPVQVRQVADTIIAELDGFKMPMGEEGRSGGVQNILLDNDRVTQDPSGAWRTQLDLLVTL